MGPKKAGKGMMVTFIIALSIVSIFLIAGVALHMYIRPDTSPRYYIKRDRRLHNEIFAHETSDEDCFFLPNP